MIDVVAKKPVKKKKEEKKNYSCTICHLIDI
jgi:hypothetical protein